MATGLSPVSALSLGAPLEAIPGVGSERAALLARLKCRTLGDLLCQRPRRYEDRRRLLPIAEMRLSEPCSVRGVIVALGTKYYQHRCKSVFEIIVEDGTARLHGRWWNLPYMERYFKIGDEVVVFGKPLSLKPRTVDHPETEVVDAGSDPSVHLNRIVPVYPLTEGLSQRWLRALIWRLLTIDQIAFPEPQPSATLPGFPSRAVAFRWLHFPEEPAQAETARQRLGLDEFIELQVGIQSRRRNLLANATGLPCAGNNRWIRPWLAGLGFRLTSSQTSVLQALRHEMGSGQPMRRLLQGDVGSGKTVVAGACALMALESGFSAVLMAPTEILATQHYDTFQHWFSPFNIPVELHTAAHQATLPPTAPCLVIGTHALLETAFSVSNLGLVIIDEQHKFGVVQREQLVRKGRYPHLLVMTATPIPRTLGLTLYGDLDLAVLTELPGGRGKVKTFVRSPDRLPQVYAFVRQKLAEGRQAYVIYPLVEESDRVEWKAVTQQYEALRKELAPFQIGLVHGRLSAEVKSQVMLGFREHRVHVLLATSVIEVGVDVPNATVMLIENAEQFGLAQLHQLRGRIARSAHPAYCIMMAAARTPAARLRLQVLAETNDGFRIAEVDLALRGPGELLGQQQSGLPALRFGNLATDISLMEQARQFAAERLGTIRPSRPPESTPR